MRELDMFSEYMEYERNYSANTIDSYTRDIKQFFNFTKTDIKEVTTESVLDFVIHLHKKGNCVRTTNRKLSSLKSFYRFLVRKGIMQSNPADPVECGKLEQRLPKPANPEDIELMIKTTDNLRDRTIMEVLYATGMRRAELINIKVSDINFREGYIKTIGKGSKERIVPLTPEAISLIKQLIKKNNSTWLFPSRKNKKNHLSSRQLNTIISKWVRKSGLTELNITPHSFRHTLCTVLFENGADIKTIQDIAGHSSINTTNLYTKVSVKRNKEAYLNCHPRTRATI